MKKLKLIVLSLACLLLVSCSITGANSTTRKISENAIRLSLSDDAITVDGAPISNNEADAVYLSNDIVYYKDGIVESIKINSSSN